MLALSLSKCGRGRDCLQVPPRRRSSDSQAAPSTFVEPTADKRGQKAEFIRPLAESSIPRMRRLRLTLASQNLSRFQHDDFVGAGGIEPPTFAM